MVDRELGVACLKGIRHVAWASLKTAGEMSKRALNGPSGGVLARLLNIAVEAQAWARLLRGEAFPATEGSVSVGVKCLGQSRQSLVVYLFIYFWLVCSNFVSCFT